MNANLIAAVKKHELELLKLAVEIFIKPAILKTCKQCSVPKELCDFTQQQGHCHPRCKACRALNAREARKAPGYVPPVRRKAP